MLTYFQALRRTAWLLLLLPAAALLHAGCAAPAATVVDEPLPGAAAADSVSSAPEPFDEIVMPRRSADNESAPPRRLYSLQMKEAGIQDLLFALSEQTGLNIAIDPSVSGTVTVDLHQVTLSQALDTVLTPHGLEYVQEGNFIKVYKPALMTRIFDLNYITTVRRGKGTVSGAIGGRDRSSGQDAGGPGAGGQEQAGSGGYSEVSSQDFADLWSGLEKVLETLKSAEGSLSINRVANSIIVMDYPRNIERIQAYITALEGAVQRQVLIEASIIEVSLSEDYQAGINWGFIQNLPQMSNFQWGMATRGASPWLGYSGSGSSGGEGDGGGGSGGATAVPGKITIRPFSGTLGIGALGQSILLTDIAEALSTQGDVNILSKPRITTLNNQPAIIKVAREDVYFQTSRSTTFGETTTETNVNFLSVGIVLSVTPQISSDGYITMTIHPSITEKAGEKMSASGDSVPIIDVRETETVARVRNSDTIIIGGLMQDKETETVIGVPVLRDLPYLGRLFKHTTREMIKKELVIMLTPRIVSESAMSDLVSQEYEKHDMLLRSGLQPSIRR